MKIFKAFVLVCLSLSLMGCYKAVGNAGGFIVINQFKGEGYLVDEDGYKKNIEDISNKTPTVISEVAPDPILTDTTTTVREKITVKATVKFTRDKTYIKIEISAADSDVLNALRNDSNSKFVIAYYDSDGFKLDQDTIYTNNATGIVNAFNDITMLSSDTVEDCTQYIYTNVSYINITWSINSYNVPSYSKNFHVDNATAGEGKLTVSGNVRINDNDGDYTLEVLAPNGWETFSNSDFGESFGRWTAIGLSFKDAQGKELERISLDDADIEYEYSGEGNIEKLILKGDLESSSSIWKNTSRIDIVDCYI